MNPNPTTENPRPLPVKCFVVCSCGETVGQGVGAEQATAAYFAGRDAVRAQTHTRKGHDLTLRFQTAKPNFPEASA